ncbi:MAG: M42 family metallopeptidase [Candidatus Omnitrophota bacterium]
MDKNALNFFRELIESHSPSGYEHEAASLWKKRVGSFADNVKVDVHGNVTGVLNAKGSPKVMLAGHIDEIGYMVKYIDDNGYIYFSAIGGVDLHLLPGQRVWIKGKKGNVLGIIGRNPIHLQDEEERKRVSKIENLWIDIGMKTKKDAEKLVSVGDPAVTAVGFENLNDSCVIGRGFDDRAGAFVVSETLKSLAGKKMNAGVYGVATVQEELGIRGARTSAYGIAPDIGIAIDVTFATDVPGANKKKNGDITIGGGPVIARGPNINHKIFERLVKTAEKEKIPYQVEGISRATGTDANIIQLTKSGVATGLISIPNRYMHTPVELINLSDIENIIKLLSAFIAGLDSRTSFIPY